MSSVVVIGGGISGLASAALLARDGHQVTLLEAQSELGGRAGSWAADGFRFDTGPSWYLMPEVFDHFYRLMGTSADEQLNLVTLDPGYRVYFEGVADPIDVAASREENVALFERVRRGSGRRLDRYLDSAAQTYALAKKHFLYTSFQSIWPLLNREVLGRLGPLVVSLLEPLASLTRRTMRDDRLRKILGYPALFLGASPYIAPSMYGLMSHLDLNDGVLYPVGGFARVIESIADLAKAQGVTVVTGARATRILTSAGVATGVEYVGAHNAKHTVSADLVVSAVDLHFSETALLAPEQQTYPEAYWDKKVPGPGAVLLYLGVRGDLPELEHHTMLFAKDWKAGFDAIFGSDPRVPQPPSLYICKPSGVDPDVAPDDHENLFVLVPVPADAGFGKGGVDGKGDRAVEALADTVIAQIARWAGIPDLAARVTVRRTVGPSDFAADLNAWRGTALGPAHTLRQSAFFRTGNVSRKVRALYFVGGSTLPGIGLPMCLISAELLLKRLNGDRSTRPLPEPPRAPERRPEPTPAAGSAPPPVLHRVVEPVLWLRPDQEPEWDPEAEWDAEDEEAADQNPDDDAEGGDEAEAEDEQEPEPEPEPEPAPVPEPVEGPAPEPEPAPVPEPVEGSAPEHPPVAHPVPRVQTNIERLRALRKRMTPVKPSRVAAPAQEEPEPPAEPEATEPEFEKYSQSGPDIWGDADDKTTTPGDVVALLYLLVLLVALAGMVVLDRKFRLFFWRDARRAAIVLVAGLAFFLLWDVEGIRVGIFFRGQTSISTGILLAPQLPLEEPFFLLLLCYLAMNLYGFAASRKHR